MPEVSPSENPGVLSPTHDPSPALVRDHPVSQVCPGSFPETVPSDSSHCKRYSRAEEAEGDSRRKPVTDLGFLIPLYKHHSFPAAAGSARSPLFLLVLLPLSLLPGTDLLRAWHQAGQSRLHCLLLLAGGSISPSEYLHKIPTPGSLPEPLGTPRGLSPITILLSLLVFPGEVGPCLFHAACVLGRLGFSLVLQPQVTFYMVRLKGQDPWLSLQHAPAAPQFPIACEELVWGISPWGTQRLDFMAHTWAQASLLMCSTIVLHTGVKSQQSVATRTIHNSELRDTGR